MATSQEINSAFLELEKAQFLARQAFFEAVKVGKVPGEADRDQPIGGPSYPPAYTAATAEDNILHGYGEEGLRGGRLLDDELLKSRLKSLETLMARPELASVPEDMRRFGLLRGLSEFDANPSFASPFPYAAENYGGVSLQLYLDRYWANKALGGSVSGK